jgi:hypothetical protein
VLHEGDTNTSKSEADIISGDKNDLGAGTYEIGDYVSFNGKGQYEVTNRYWQDNKVYYTLNNGEETRVTDSQLKPYEEETDDQKIKRFWNTHTQAAYDKMRNLKPGDKAEFQMKNNKWYLSTVDISWDPANEEPILTFQGHDDKKTTEKWRASELAMASNGVKK